MIDTLQELKNKSITFNEETKKAIKGCQFAAMNVNDNGIVNVWGDFSSRRAAIKAIKAWGFLAAKLKGKFTSSLEGRFFRVVLTFQ